MAKRKAPVQNPITKNNLELPTIQPKTDNQEKFFDLYSQYTHHFMFGPAGTGKAQPLYSKILTSEGWITMGDVKVGTIVRSTDSWTTVTAIHPQGLKDTVRLYFKDKSYVDCCSEHLWTVNLGVSKTGKKQTSKKVTINTYSIMKLLDNKKAGNISIDTVKPIEYPQQELPLDPYVLGVLIGDGGMTTTSVSITSVDEEIVNNVNNKLPEKISLRKRSNSISYGIVDEQSTWQTRNRVTEALSNLSLLGKKSEFKFIPSIYMFSSIEQRKNLLKGLMDTDGTVDRTNCSYSTSSKELAENVKELVLSLGGRASINNKKPFYKDKNGNKKYGLTSYIVSVLLPDNKDCFTLTRKLEKVKNNDSKQLKRIISDYEVLSPTEMQCISVDHPSHLYVTDDYVLTHNTFLALYKALESLAENQAHKITIFRSSVASISEGFLPGSAEDKLAVFETPYISNINKIFGRDDAYGILKKIGTINFESIAYQRGNTLDNQIIVIDEAQNCTGHQLDTLITRTGKNSRLIICGDLNQQDITKHGEKNVHKAFQVLQSLPSVATTEFTLDDIVRSGLVREYLIAKHLTYPAGY
jgi:phosphate starvation-inducible protein PhoH